MSRIVSSLFAALLGQAPASYAVELAEDHIGEVLIFPFFITEQGWDTYISVHSESRRNAVPGDSLSLRVVLREGSSGEIIDHFNTYPTGPNGEAVWRAAFFQNEEGQTMLRVAEGQCLVDSSGHARGGPGAVLPVDASVGLIEVYSMVHPRSVTADCEQYAGNWSDQGAWAEDPSEGEALDWQRREISGEGILINVSEGLSGMFTATALRDFSGDPLLHTHPGSSHPNLTDAAGGIDAVAFALRAQILSNDVITLDEVDASTDWIISYPTSGYHAAKAFDVMIDGEARNCSSLGQPAQGDDPVVSIGVEQALPILFSTSGTDFIGAFGSVDITPMPSVEIGVALCNAVNVVSFRDKPSLLLPDNSSLLYTLGEVTAGAASHVWWQPPPVAEPVLAFRLTRFVNGTLEGGTVLANYSFMAPHRRNVGILD